MVTIESDIYNKTSDDDIILGAKIIVYNSADNEVKKISIVDETELNNLKSKLDVLDETFVRFNDNSSLKGESIDSLLSNPESNVVINATKLAGVTIDNFSRIGHSHDDRYFTESESMAKFSQTGHTHDDRYYTETEVDDKLTSHSHSSWTEIKVNSYATIWVNTKLRLVDFSYYRENYNFTSTNGVTLHEGKNYPNNLKLYKPSHSVKFACYNPNITGYIDSSGNIIFRSDSTGTKNINASAMWHY